MGQAVLTEFLLKLATDPEALEEHRQATETELDALMTKAKLTPSHKAAIKRAMHENDGNHLVEAVREELNACSSIEPGTGTPITFMAACCVSRGFPPPR